MSNQFSAREPALGYLYQVRYALLMLLIRVQDDVNTKLSIESLDDVVFEDDGEPLELIQAKHHVTHRASLSNASHELWGTLRIWSERLKEDASALRDVTLTLVTTGTASSTSAASLLRRDESRNENQALMQLLETARGSESQTNSRAYKSFLGLSEAEQYSLINKIRILDNSPNIIDVKEQIRGKLRLSTRHVDSIYSRVEGWWFNEAISHLMPRGETRLLSGVDLLNKIYEIQNSLLEDNLPNDFPALLELSEDDLAENERVFVHQLKLILLGQTRLRIAIGDYYHAFQQRSKWLEEGLVFPLELEQYEDYLVSEWRRQFEIMREDLGELPDDATMERLGKALFRWVEENPVRPIREKYKDTYLSRGSFHILANGLKVGWHPLFAERIEAIISEAVHQLS